MSTPPTTPQFAPGSLQSFYIADMPGSIFNDSAQMNSGMRTRTMNNPNVVLRNAFIWDMYSLSQTVPLSQITNRWQQLWPLSFSDDAGSQMIQELNTAFAVNIFNHYVAESCIYSGKFSISPLIGGVYGSEGSGVKSPEIMQGERILWKLAIFPGMPFLINTSAPGFTHFGPSFIKEIEFKASSQGEQIPAVNIDVAFSGGKSYKINQTTVTAPILYYGGSASSSSGSSSSGIGPDYIPYRVATFIDCLIGLGSWKDINTMLSDQVLIGNLVNETPNLSNFKNPYYRIVEFSLSITQEVHFQAPATTSLTSKAYTIKDGPRWCEIFNRKVIGKVVFYSRLSQMTAPSTSPITMYFGGPFFFPMDNVEWAAPVQVLNAGNGYLHTFNFIARAADASAENSLSAHVTTPMSEFAINPDYTGTGLGENTSVTTKFIG